MRSLMLKELQAFVERNKKNQTNTCVFRKNQMKLKFTYPATDLSVEKINW